MLTFSWEFSPNSPSRLQRVLVAALVRFVLAMTVLALPLPLAAGPANRPLPSARSGPVAGVAASITRSGISGQIVDSATGAPISGGEAIVALEQPDGTGTDVIFTQASPDDSGRFSFNPLPLASTFDVVAVAINGSGIAYNATVLIGVSAGTDLRAVPLTAESRSQDGPARIEGIVTASPGSGSATIRATVSAIQTIDLREGLSIPVDVPQTITISSADYRRVTIPGERGTSANLFVRSASACPSTMPPNVNCARYMIVVPAGKPSVGLFDAGKLSYAPPAAGPANYSVRANSFMPYGAGASVCFPSFLSVATDSDGRQLTTVPGGTSVAQPISFTGCW